jgi:RND family efflux transporter MFP subunit
LLLLSACTGKQSSAKATPTPIPTPAIAAKSTFQVQIGEITNELFFRGRIVPVTEQGLSFRVGGRVKKVYVKKGDAVKESQLLAELETTRSEFDIRRAQVNLEIAQYNLELVKLQTPKTSELYTVTIAIKEGEVELAQINLDEMNTDFSKVRLTSPVTGTVLSVVIAEGNMIEAAKPAITVANLTDLEISADMSREDMALVAAGMKVIISPPSSSDPAIEGVIRSMPYPFGSGEGTDTVRVSLNTQPSELGFALGDLVRMSILLEKKVNILWLPPQAIRDFEGRKFVIVQDSAGQRRVDIKTGIETYERVEILEGLKEGDIVVAP